MPELAAPVAVAAFLAMFIAALRLLTHTDELHGRTYITVSSAFCVYLFFHALAASLPFAFYQLWPKSWTAVVSMSPWALVLLSPWLVNGMLTLDWLGFPNATGGLGQFLDRVRRDFEQRMIDADYAALLKLIAPYAKGLNLFEARALAMRRIPSQFESARADAAKRRIESATTVEDLMEVYIRHVGKRSFRQIFAKSEIEKVIAPTPLFDQLEKPHLLARVG